MKYKVEHKEGEIELTVNKRNSFKNTIKDGKVVKRQCGDCKQSLDINHFPIWTRKRKPYLASKCRNCHRVRSLLRQAIKGFKRESSIQKLLGCDYGEFQCWINTKELTLESEDIHIDHIVPHSLANNDEDKKVLNHYSNLQLLPSKENIKKGNKSIKKQHLERVLENNPGRNRICQIIKDSKIKIE